MRAQWRFTVSFGAAFTALGALGAASLGACKWTEFDDLSDQTWVTSTEKPNVKSSDYGVALQRGTLSSSATGGGTLVVIGAGAPTFSQLAYSAKGDASLATANTLDLNSQFGIGTLDPQPIVLADPIGDDVSLIVNSGSGSIVVLTGSGQMTKYQLFITPSTVNAATYMQAPPRAETPTVPQPLQPLVASGTVVVGTFYTNSPNPQPKCTLLDGATVLSAHALGAVSNGTTDDVVVWASTGKLYRFPSSVFNGCADPGVQPLGPGVDTAFAPGAGAQILSLDATHVVLQGHHDSDDKSFLQVFNVSGVTPAAVGGSVSIDKLRTATLLTEASKTFVVGGYPTAIVDGKTSGQVMLFEVSASGLTTTPAETLNDAQPDDNESFGRAVAALPFNGGQVIAVAASNEIFTYFRANLADGTSLYHETRQGR